MVLSRLPMDRGIFLVMLGGWFEALLTYVILLLGFFVEFVCSVSVHSDVQEVNYMSVLFQAYRYIVVFKDTV